MHEEPIQTRPPQEAKAPYEYKVTYTPFGLKKPERFWFSKTELGHLFVSALLVMGVGVVWLVFLGTLEATLIGAFIFVWIFLLHEIAHKLVAQHYGLWAEFRLIMFGALLTLISIISPFKIISPGAVMIAGNSSKEKVGKTAIAGPSLNIALCSVFFILTFVLGNQNPFFLVAVFSAAISAFIAVFNLIPFAMLDGLKVLNWNKLIWIIVFALSLALLIMIYAFYPFLLT